MHTVTHTDTHLAVVLAQVQPLKDVTVPWLQVDSERSLALATSLVHVPAHKGQTVTDQKGSVGSKLTEQSNSQLAAE